MSNSERGFWLNTGQHSAGSAGIGRGEEKAGDHHRALESASQHATVRQELGRRLTPFSVAIAAATICISFCCLGVEPQSNSSGAGSLVAVSQSSAIKVDFSRRGPEIRPLHGGNSGPLNYGGLVDLTAFHREAAIPFTRLHDCHWPNPDVVDIHTIFPDFNKNPDDPDSYDFERTDAYLQAVRAAGSEIIFRLGESIEHTPRKYRVNPPSDPHKWASICLGIIRHYNEGWANGYRWKIRYWEIWNEPDVRPNMWTGTDDQFLTLFEIAAKRIKERFPELKVGGPAFGSVGRLSADGIEPTPFAKRFLVHCRERNVPLDFFSWHTYSADPELPPRIGQAIRRLLDEHGFQSTESHLNEWNYLPDDDWSPMFVEKQGLPRQAWFARIGGVEGAAFSACVLMNLQEAPVDVANYFTAEIQGFGLFTFDGVPKKTFHAFRAFNLLRQTPLSVLVTKPEGTGLSIRAGLSRSLDRANLLLSNFNAGPTEFALEFENLPWSSPTDFVVFAIDSLRDLEPVQSQVLIENRPLICRVPSPGICLVRLTPAHAAK
jgi:hypothetical protein